MFLIKRYGINLRTAKSSDGFLQPSKSQLFKSREVAPTIWQMSTQNISIGDRRCCNEHVPICDENLESWHSSELHMFMTGLNRCVYRLLDFPSQKKPRTDTPSHSFAYEQELAICSRLVLIRKILLAANTHTFSQSSLAIRILPLTSIYPWPPIKCLSSHCPGLSCFCIVFWLAKLSLPSRLANLTKE